MSRSSLRSRASTDVLNALAFGTALVLAIWGGSVGTGRGVPEVARQAQRTPGVTPETLAGGKTVLRDASGTAVPLVRYERIASGTLIADRVLSDLCEPTRIVSFTGNGAANSTYVFRLTGKPQLPARAPVEAVLALKPDLLIVNNLVDPGYVDQLREHGVRVFDLGHMHGLASLLQNIQAIGWLIGAPERAEHYARSLARRMARVAQDRTGKAAPAALYISMYGDRMYGGARGTSYHDVLVHAGLRDIAAEAGLEGWPELTGEQVLAMNPEVLVTHRNMGAVLCRHAGFELLRPCRGQGKLVEIEGLLIDDPGPSILDATELLYDAVWGDHP